MHHHLPPITAQETALCRRLKSVAAQCGFVSFGVASAEPIAAWRRDQFAQWLECGQAAGMEYLHRQAPLRQDLTSVLPEVQTVFSFALPYAAKQPFGEGDFRISRYALGRDYHDVVREKIRQFVSLLGLTEEQQGRVCCDTAPVDERYWAWRCGVGQWMDNAQIAVDGYGSFVFLGEWLCPLTIQQLSTHLDTIFPDEMGENAADAVTNGNEIHVSSCLSCGRCYQACPGGALSARGLDASKCLSYLTIEYRGDLPASVSQQMGLRIYGCDTCAEVCPVNRPILSGTSAIPIPVCDDFWPLPELTAMRPDDWANLTVDQYRRLFKGSAVKRAKYEGLMRNIRAVRGADDVEGIVESDVLM